MPIPSAGPGQHYADAEDYFQHHSREADHAWATTALIQAQELLGRKGALLDIGSGRGELLRTAKEEGWAVIGVETSPKFAAIAERYSGAKVLRAPLEKCDLASESFDVVILGAVLEHLYNPDEVMREVARVLRHGAILYVDVPNEEGLYFRMGNLYHKLRRRDWVVNLSPTFPPFHVFGFGPRSLRALLTKHGLSVAKWHVYAGVSLVPARTGIVTRLEREAARLVTAVSRVASLGSYIETWAVKS